MGLLRYRGFSSIPTLLRKIQSRREQKEKYSPTWQEWAVQNGEQIFASDSQAGTGTTILRTVPDDKILFISSAWISAIHEGVAGTDIVCNLESQGKRILTILLDQNEGGQLALSFPMPLRIEGGQTVNIIVGGVAEAFAGFVGFEIPQSLEIV